MSELEAARRVAVWVTGLHTGGCSACAESVAALAAPPYAARLRALGVTLARTPRQSDIILLSGALTAQARASVDALIAGVPQPRALVAVGDCAVNGCVFAGSPQLTVPLAQALHVNVEIGGCPPEPDAIIDAIAEAQRLLVAEATTAPRPEQPTIQPTSEAVDAPATPAEPDHATRLAALIESARDGWDDDDEDDEALADSTDAAISAADTTDATEANETIETIESNHLAGKRDGASAPTTRQPGEKRK